MSPTTSVDCLLRFFTSFNYNILWIWSIVLSLISKRLVIVVSKSSYRVSRAITIAIVFQGSQTRIIAVLSLL